MEFKSLLTGFGVSLLIAISGSACSQQAGEPATPSDQSSLVNTQDEIASAPVLLPSAEFLEQVRASEDAILIDCRTPAEFAAGALPKAVNIDYRSPNFMQRVQELDTSRPIYVYCQAGGRSARAAKLIAAEGFPGVYDLEGGYGSLR